MYPEGWKRPGSTPEPSDSSFPVPPSVEQVYRDYALRVFSTARRMLRCDLDAEDVTQDVLLQVVRKLSGFRGDSAFPTWLHRVTVNAALLHRRRALRREYKIAGTLDDLSDERADRSSKRRWQRSPVNQLIEHETRLAVEKAISGLPDGYREVLIASDIDGLPNQAIAAALGLGLAAVKSRLHRARRMLRDALEPLFTERRPPTRAGA